MCCVVLYMLCCVWFHVQCVCVCDPWKTCTVPVPSCGSRPQRPAHSMVPKDEGRLTSLWTGAWARDAWQPWTEVPAGMEMSRGSGPRNPPSCAAAPCPLLPASRSLQGRTPPCHGRTGRTPQAPWHPGARHPLPRGGRGLERWMAGSETSSWWTPQPAASAAHSSSLSTGMQN